MDFTAEMTVLQKWTLMQPGNHDSENTGSSCQDKHVREQCLWGSLPVPEPRCPDEARAAGTLSRGRLLVLGSLQTRGLRQTCTPGPAPQVIPLPDSWVKLPSLSKVIPRTAPSSPGRSEKEMAQLTENAPGPAPLDTR